MKKRIIFIVPTLIILVALILLYVYFQNNNFNVNMEVTNKTGQSQNIDIRVLLGLENTSKSNEIISMSNIKSGDTNKIKKTIHTPKGDFGLILNIEESPITSHYFISGTKISYVQYLLEITNSTDGNTILKGDLIIKNLFGSKEKEKIEPIIIKGE